MAQKQNQYKGSKASENLLTKDDIKKGQTTLAMGGGEPIAKGHKRTNEKRVMQPRDPETGQFDYNASAGMSRKDPYHAERNGSHGGKGGGGQYKTVPAYLRNKAENEEFVQVFAQRGIKKGEVITLNGIRFTAIADWSKEELQEAIENYFEDGKGNTVLGKADDMFVRSRGTASNKEMEADVSGAGDNYFAGFKSKVGKSTKQKMKQAMDAYANNPQKGHFVYAQKAADLDADKLEINKAYNEFADKQKASAPAPTPTPIQNKAPTPTPSEAPKPKLDDAKVNAFVSAWNKQHPDKQLTAEQAKSILK